MLHVNFISYKRATTIIVFKRLMIDYCLSNFPKMHQVVQNGIFNLLEHSMVLFKSASKVSYKMQFNINDIYYELHLFILRMKYLLICSLCNLLSTSDFEKKNLNQIPMK